MHHKIAEQTIIEQTQYDESTKNTITLFTELP